MASKYGLFHIGLTSDRMMGQFLFTFKKEGSGDDFKDRPLCLRPVICNMEAVLLFQSHSGRTKARKMLERLNKQYPKDLNILADLIHVYRKAGRRRDLHIYEKRIESLKGDPLLQARCILAHAFVLHFVLNLGSDITPDALMKDHWRHLSVKEDHLEGLSRVRNLIEDANKVSKATGADTIDGIRIANEKYKKGIEMLTDLDCSKEELSVWKSYYAENGFTLHFLLDSISENLIIVLQTYGDVIENLTSIENLQGPLKGYLARSYIAIAYLSTVYTFSLDHADLPEIIRGQNIQSMYLKGFSVLQDARCLFHYAIYLHTKKMYLEAIEVMNKYISYLPDTDTDIDAYYLRGDIYVKYCSEMEMKASNEEMSHKIQEYSKLAYKDMKRGLKSTNIDRLGKVIIAEIFGWICLRRAMCYESGIDFCCQNTDFIYEAIDILNEALKEWVMTDNHTIYDHLGVCYLYVGEFREGIESLKISLELSDWKEGPSRKFLYLCGGFMILYRNENDKDSLSELRLIIKEAEKRGCNEWVIESLSRVYYAYPEFLIDLVQNMIDWDLRGCQKIIEEALRRLKVLSSIDYLVLMKGASIPMFHAHNPGLETESEQYEYFNRLLGLFRFVQDKVFYLYVDKNISVLHYLEEQLKSKLEETIIGESDDNVTTEIRKTQTREIFKYDFFVSHSEKDQVWVDSMLRPRLEEFDDEINFRGFIPFRDSVPGEPIIDSMIREIKRSRKLLIILTPSYLKDNWQNYLSDQMIFSVIESKMKEKTIIPIIMEPCKVPDKLKNFSPISFIEKSDWKQLHDRLTKDVGSMMELEDDMSTLTLHDNDNK